jgi:butyryl-CoA dehydrogenase
MEFGLTKEQVLIQKAAREYAQKFIAPVAEKIDQENRVPDEIIEGLGELDLFGVPFSEEFGGADAGYMGYVLAMEQIAQGSSGVAMVMSAHTLALSAINAFGTPEQKKKYLAPAATGDIILACGSTEAVGGSNQPEFSTTAVLDGNEWVINGGKVLITNIVAADVYVVLAVTSDKVAEGAKAGLSGFIVEKDAPGFEVGKPEHKLGWHGSSTGSISFKNCRIPKENLLGPLGGCLQAMFVSATDEFASCGPVSLGIAEGAYEMALKYSLERVQMGKSMFDRFQVTRHKLVKMYEEIESLKALVYSTYARKDQGDLVLAHGRMLKCKGAEVSEYVCREAIQLFGGVGCIIDTGEERFWRDAKVMAIGGASVEALMDQIAYMIKNKMV